jgi:hypothetical protein
VKRDFSILFTSVLMPGPVLLNWDWLMREESLS